jgi:hypothetical protein
LRQNVAAASTSSVLQSMMNPASRLLCMGAPSSTGQQN